MSTWQKFFPRHGVTSRSKIRDKFFYNKIEMKIFWRLRSSCHVTLTSLPSILGCSFKKPTSFLKNVRLVAYSTYTQKLRKIYAWVKNSHKYSIILIGFLCRQFSPLFIITIDSSLEFILPFLKVHTVLVLKHPAWEERMKVKLFKQITLVYQF